VTFLALQAQHIVIFICGPAMCPDANSDYEVFRFGVFFRISIILFDRQRTPGTGLLNM
jgi:hypothetical protein